MKEDREGWTVSVEGQEAQSPSSCRPQSPSSCRRLGYHLMSEVGGLGVSKALAHC